jgi:hypothetical protein
MNLMSLFKSNLPNVGTTSASYTATSGGATTGIIAAGVNVAYVTNTIAGKVTLPTPVQGAQLLIINKGTSANTLSVIGSANTITINGIAGTPAVITVPASAAGALNAVFCLAISATEWLCEGVNAVIA